MPLELDIVHLPGLYRLSGEWSGFSLFHSFGETKNLASARTAEVSDAGSASSPHDIIQLTHVSQGRSVMVPYRALYLMPSWMEYKE